MKKFNKLSNVQIIAIGFFLLALTGAVLLMLPVSSRTGSWTPFLPSLFTSVSASCVTGLVKFDTATQWSLFGQIVILILIQIGGLGFITIATVFLSFARKNLGLRNRSLMAESINTGKIAGLKAHVKWILIGTAVIEGIGALLLSVPFIRDFGVAKGLYYGLFHSVSAFCNAGFDLIGVREPYSSLTYYQNDLYVNLIFILLITIGGIGFQVWTDVRQFGFRLRRYSLHSKIVLVFSAILTFGGALVFFLLERTRLLAGETAGHALLQSLFQSVTCRTAGFNTMELSEMSDTSVLFGSLLMFIGGSPGSTAGGVKTVTFAVIFVSLLSSLRSVDEPRLFGRTLPKEAIKKASGVIAFNFSLAFIVILIISFTGSFRITDVIFEAFSAIGTVGMSTGITRDLNTVGSVCIMLLMFCGRVGSVTLASAFLEKRARPRVQYPTEEISIG